MSAIHQYDHLSTSDGDEANQIMNKKSEVTLMRRSWVFLPVREQPEPFLVIFAFLLNFVWEMWQAPFFSGVANGAHWENVMLCTRASIGDALISLCAFWVVSLIAQSRDWLLAPHRWSVTTFVAIGLGATIALEALATGPLARWQYGSLMPRLPLLGTGLLPIIQWLILPPAGLWLARNQIVAGRQTRE